MRRRKGKKWDDKKKGDMGRIKAMEAGREQREAGELDVRNRARPWTCRRIKRNPIRCCWCRTTASIRSDELAPKALKPKARRWLELSSNAIPGVEAGAERFQMREEYRPNFSSRELTLTESKMESKEPDGRGCDERRRNYATLGVREAAGGGGSGRFEAD